MATRAGNGPDVTVCEGVFGEISSGFGRVRKREEFLNLAQGDCSCEFYQPSEIVKVKSYTLRNENGMSVKVITFGATIVSLKTPDKYGDKADIVMGFDNIKYYMNPSFNNYMGCILGRCANRIKDGKFRMKNDDYQLTKNECNIHHLHGGRYGFGRHLWDAFVDDDCSVVMSYLSEDGEEGYPGNVLTTVRFELTRDNRLIINMKATTSKPTIVNLSHASLFNLAGHDAGEEELKAHRVSLNCDRWTFAEFVDPIPTGAVRGVGGTVMDLRVPKLLRDVIENVPQGEGFDHNFCVIKGSKSEVTFLSRVLHAKSGRFLEVYSNQPAVQFYTGGRLPPAPYTLLTPESEDLIAVEDQDSNNPCKCCKCDEPCICETPPSSASGDNIIEFLPGKCGTQYKKFGAFSIVPQNYPNAINIEHFPCTILRPGQVYKHDLVYKFGVQLGGYM